MRGPVLKYECVDLFGYFQVQQVSCTGNHDHTRVRHEVVDGLGVGDRRLLVEFADQDQRGHINCREYRSSVMACDRAQRVE